MIAWQGKGDTAEANDYWSYRRNTPKLDDVQSLESTYTISDDKETVSFVTKRKLDTGESTEDFLIPL